MKYYELDKEEQEILDAFESGSFTSVKDIKAAKERALQAAKNTLDKKKNINIRLSERDLHKLKTKAIEEGIPYQTLATSILHKAVK
jgi:predicted DNA binding CopG/RHH family protein